MTYDEKTYCQIGLENLVLFGIYIVTSKSDICTFERLVKECFSHFPKVFAFKRYPKWPDSLKFDRSLRKLREKGMIVGTIRDSFSLTDFGKQKSLEIESFFKKDIKNVNKKRKDRQERSAEDKLIEYLKGSKEFKKYLQDPFIFSISEPDFRNLLRCTLESPVRIVKQNLKYYKKISKQYKEEKIYEFLINCGKQYKMG